MMKGTNMTDLYSTIKAHRGPIRVMVTSRNEFFWVEVKKGDLLDQVSRRGLDLTEMDVEVDPMDSDVLWISRKD
jgi:hypothetical protein